MQHYICIFFCRNVYYISTAARRWMHLEWHLNEIYHIGLNFPQRNMRNTDRVTQWRKNPSSEPHYICPNKCELLASIPLLPSPLPLLQSDRSSGLQHLWDPQGAEPPFRWLGRCAAKLGLNKTLDTVQWFLCVNQRRTKKRGEWKVRIYHTRTLNVCGECEWKHEN